MSNPINNANDDGDTPLIVAVRNNDLGTVNSLVLAGADHRPRNNAGESALSLALASGHDELRNLVTAHVLTTCIMGLVPPPAASREPSPEPSASPEASPEASSEASPELSPDSDDWKFRFLETFVFNKVKRSTDSPEGSPEPSPKRQRQAPPASP